MCGLWNSQEWNVHSLLVVCTATNLIGETILACVARQVLVQVFDFSDAVFEYCRWNYIVFGIGFGQRSWEREASGPAHNNISIMPDPELPSCCIQHVHSLIEQKQRTIHTCLTFEATLAAPTIHSSFCLHTSSMAVDRGTARRSERETSLRVSRHVGTFGQLSAGRNRSPHKLKGEGGQGCEHAPTKVKSVEQVSRRTQG